MAPTAVGNHRQPPWRDAARRGARRGRARGRESVASSFAREKAKRASGDGRGDRAGGLGSRAHLFRGELGVSEPNEDSQEGVVGALVVAVHLANALKEVVPAADRRLGLLRGGNGSFSGEGESGRPGKARRAPRRARHPSLGGGLKSAAERERQAASRGSCPPGCAKLRRAPRDAARDARGKARLRSIRAFPTCAAGEQAGWMGSPERPPCRPWRWRTCTAAGGEGTGSESGPMDEILERRRAESARSRGAVRATIRAVVDVNPSTRDVRRSSGKTRPRAGRRRARGPRLGRCHSPCPTRVGGESRRRGVACRAKGRARTSGRKQLNPSSKSGCPPRRLFTRRTTSGVSDLRIEGSAARQRGAVIAPSYGGF